MEEIREKHFSQHSVYIDLHWSKIRVPAIYYLKQQRTFDFDCQLAFGLSLGIADSTVARLIFKGRGVLERLPWLPVRWTSSWGSSPRGLPSNHPMQVIWGASEATASQIASTPALRDWWESSTKNSSHFSYVLLISSLYFLRIETLYFVLVSTKTQQEIDY